MNRRRTALLVLGLVVLVGVAGWAAGHLIRSPADVAAQTSPPEPSPILVPVEERLLSSDVVTRGTARFGSPQDLRLAQSAFKEEPGVVTSLPEPGTQVASGDVLLTVSGRPVFLLAGEQPSYRDLGPGMSGGDVRQLEEAMSALGLDPGAVDGTFDQATGAAISRLYADAGSAPVVASEEVLEAVRPLAADLVSGARAGPGVQLPADEVVFVANPPVRVSELAIDVGDEPADPLMTVTDAVVAIDSSVPIEEARLVRAGMPVVIDEPDLGIEETGVISSVAAGPGTNGVDGFHVYLEILVDDAPEEIVGTSLRLTVPVESTSGAVLAVPVSALTLGADGSTRVEKVTDTGTELVTVDPGLSADGYVEVAPLEGTLEAGDIVVIGLEAALGQGS